VLVTAGATREPLDPVRFSRMGARAHRSRSGRRHFPPRPYRHSPPRGRRGVAGGSLHAETFSSTVDLWARLERRLGRRQLRPRGHGRGSFGLSSRDDPDGKNFLDDATLTLTFVRNPKILPQLKGFSPRPVTRRGLQAHGRGRCGRSPHLRSPGSLPRGASTAWCKMTSTRSVAAQRTFSGLFHSRRCARGDCRGARARGPSAQTLQMRLLALSVGNTSLFGSVFRGKKPGAIFRVPLRESEILRRPASKGRDQSGADGEVHSLRAGDNSSLLRLSAARSTKQCCAPSCPHLPPKLRGRSKVNSRGPAQVERRFESRSQDRLRPTSHARRRFAWPRRSGPVCSFRASTWIVVDCAPRTTVTALHVMAIVLGARFYRVSVFGPRCWPRAPPSCLSSLCVVRRLHSGARRRPPSPREFSTATPAPFGN